MQAREAGKKSREWSQAREAMEATGATGIKIVAAIAVTPKPTEKDFYVINDENK
jgi:hypothetical protein